MNLMYNILPIYYLLLEVCVSMRNFHLPQGVGYLRHSDLAMQHDNNYQHYDSYSSEEVVMRQRQSPRRTKYQRHFEYSDSEYNYKCKCSCTKCQKRKLKPCCENFCANECAVQNNILVVPYPVPFIVFNQSAPSEFPMPPMPPISTPSSITTTTTAISTESSTTQTTTPSKKTIVMTSSTEPYYDHKFYKRFKILNEKNLRRNMGMGNKGLRSPHKFGRLPKYGIVPLPENLALNLMQQIRNDQLRKRLALDKNILDYTGLPNAQ